MASPSGTAMLATYAALAGAPQRSSRSSELSISERGTTTSLTISRFFDCPHATRENRNKLVQLEWVWRSISKPRTWRQIFGCCQRQFDLFAQALSISEPQRNPLIAFMQLAKKVPEGNALGIIVARLPINLTLLVKLPCSQRCNITA